MIRKMYTQFITSIFMLCTVSFSSKIFAQFQGPVYKEDTTIKVFVGLQEQPMAWCGGFNNPQLTIGDLNNDGVEDLVIYERQNRQIKTFINKGTPGNPKYVYAPHYAKNFPSVVDYLILADYNCDNVPDLFQLGNGIDAFNTGYSVYRGYYNAQHELCFSFFKNLYYDNSPTATGWVNCYVNPGDIPAIVDVDHDGDLDFVSYTNSGSRIFWYRNRQVEDNLPCDSLRIKVRDVCWGKVSQGNYREHILADGCGLPVPPPRPAKTTHPGNTLCLFDEDGDGDYDYLDGNISFDDMVFLRNGKVQYNSLDSMVYQDTTWQSNGHKINLPQWPVGFNIDADQDGLKDMIIAPHAENTSENYKCIWYYRNTGTLTAPAFTFQSDTFLIDKTIDVGSAAYPMLYDYNKDGKLDLFIGSDGYYQTGGTFRSKLSYYENTTQGSNVSFTYKTKDLLNVFAQNVRGSAPAFGDLDNDGKDDLVLGHYDGTISFYKNNASSNSVQPQWSLSQAILKDQSNIPVAVVQYAMPFIYDINKDGKPDLIIGSQNGRLMYYENVGTAGQLKLQYKTDSLGKLVVWSDFSGKSAPFIGRMDNTEKDYLLSGSDPGYIYRYDGFQNGNTTIPYTKIDSIYSNIHSGVHAAITVGDIDNDGKYEMILGNEFGGVNIYKQSMNVSDIKEVVAKNPLQLFPNPASSILYIGMSGEEISANAFAKIYNNMGQLVSTSGKNSIGNISIDISSFTPGVYLCQLQNGNISYSGVFIKNK